LLRHRSGERSEKHGEQRAQHHLHSHESTERRCCMYPTEQWIQDDEESGRRGNDQHPPTNAVGQSPEYRHQERQ